MGVQIITRATMKVKEQHILVKVDIVHKMENPILINNMENLIFCQTLTTYMT